jgi:RNA polymerase sigma factor (sigma-70 family)
MASAHLTSVLWHIHQVAGSAPAEDLTDGHLVELFSSRGEAAAFEALVRRHGPMVLSVCRRVLRDGHDAEDAFQATFLLLARKAGAIRKRESVGSWLYGVAYRIARKASAEAARRRRRERQAAELRPAAPGFDAAWRGLQAVLDEELNGLPEKYRLPLILCYLEGQTHDEAARQLGLPAGTVKSRLARGRVRLRGRLARRGLNLAAVPFAAVLATQAASGALPPGLLHATAHVCRVDTGAQSSTAIAGRVVALAEGAGETVFFTKLKVVTAWLLTLGALAAGAAFVTSPAADPPPAPHAAALPSSPPPKDCSDDPLPQGAVARLGTLRFRHGGGTIDRLLLARDGKTLLSKTHYGDRKVCAWNVATGQLLHEFPGHYEENGAVALAPDGRTVAVGHDKQIRFWDLASGRDVHQLRSSVGDVEGLAFSPDGKLLASGHGSAVILLWDLETGKQFAKLPARHNRVSFLAFTADGKTLVSGDSLDRTVRVFDVPTRTQRHQITRPKMVRGLALSPDGRLLALGNQEGAASVWDLSTGRLVRELRGWPFVSGVAFSPDGKTLATTELDQKADRNAIALWDVQTGRELHRLAEAVGPVWCVIFVPDGKTVLAASGSTIRRWDPVTGAEQGPAPGHPGYVGAIAVHGRTLAYLADSSIRLHDLATDQDIGRLAGYHWSIAFSPDGRTLAGGTDVNKVNLWDVVGRRRLRQLETDPKKAGFDWVAYYRVAFSPDGKLLAAAGRALLPSHTNTDEVVQFWDLPSGRERRRLSLKDRDNEFCTVEAIAFSPDGRTLAASGRAAKEGSMVRLWDVATGREMVRIGAGLNDPTDPGPGEQAFPRGPIIEPRIVFSPDGRLLAMNRWQKTIPIWEAATGRERLRLEGHEASTACIAFSPDSRTLASASWDNTIRLWDLTTGQELRRLTGHRGRAHALAFTDDGRRLISAGEDSTLLVWGVAAVTKRVRRKARLSAAEWKAQWEELAGADAARAQVAIARLAAAGATTVEQLEGRLTPAAAPDPVRLARLLQDLESNSFTVREKAAAELERLGDRSLPAVEQVLSRPGNSLELRRRLERLRDQLVVPSGDALRALRAVEILERMATPEARRLLETVSRGDPEARLTREARATVARLSERAEKQGALPGH